MALGLSSTWISFSAWAWFRSFSRKSKHWRISCHQTLSAVLGGDYDLGYVRYLVRAPDPSLPMRDVPLADETLVRRLPLPLAQLYRRVHNAKTALERHLTAFYLWEAGLKLLASVAIVEYVQRGPVDAELT